MAFFFFNTVLFELLVDLTLIVHIDEEMQETMQ